jgi:hypothetical protein
MHPSHVQASSKLTIEIFQVTHTEPERIAVVTIAAQECLRAAFQGVGAYIQLDFLMSNSMNVYTDFQSTPTIISRLSRLPCQGMPCW